MTDPPEIEALIVMWGEGDREALRSVIRLLYDELRNRIWLYQHLNGEAQS
jgi:hypothetical protein